MKMLILIKLSALTNDSGFVSLKRKTYQYRLYKSFFYKILILFTIHKLISSINFFYTIIKFFPFRSFYFNLNIHFFMKLKKFWQGKAYPWLGFNRKDYICQKTGLFILYKDNIEISFYSI